MMTSRFDVDFVAIITNDLSFSIVGSHLIFEAIAPTGILFALRVNIVLTSSDTCISLSCKFLPLLASNELKGTLAIWVTLFRSTNNRTSFWNMLVTSFVYDVLISDS